MRLIVPKLRRLFHDIAPRNAWHVRWISFVMLFNLPGAMAQMPTDYRHITKPICSWSFLDTTNWTSNPGYSPISFTNLNSCWLGDGDSLVVETNVPAWLNFNVIEPSTGATNLVLDAPGSLTFWYGSGWASTNGGPGQWAELIDVGEWAPDASYGYFGLSIDPAGSNLCFVAQDGAGDNYSLSAPICWTTNYFHFICLTYSSTNVSMYIDGLLQTNDPGGLSIWPGSDAISGGMYFGSDTNGIYQANGMFNLVETFNYPLASNDVQTIFNWNFNYYLADPLNVAMETFVSAPSSPSTAPVTPDVITGIGDLQSGGAASPVTGTNVYIASVTATNAANGVMNVNFTIQGGQPTNYYDVFANSVFSFGTNGVPWSWMGQGSNSGIYTISLSNGIAFLILGTPQDTSGSGLTDAYQLLVSKTNPYVTNSDLDGIPTGWEILLGLNPTNSNFTSPGQRSNYNYTPADWLNGVSGIRSGSITLDNEGNVQTVSQ